LERTRGPASLPSLSRSGRRTPPLLCALGAPGSIYQSIHKTGLKRRLVVTRWEEEITKDARLRLLLFLATVGFVLLIACANLANLLLARAATREKEMAIRSAMGACRMRIIRQFLTESLLIALLGGTLGFALAFWARGLLISLISRTLIPIAVIPMDQWVLGFGFLISIATAVALGIAPALLASRICIGTSLKEGSRSTIGPSFHRARRLIVVMEIAIVVVLLVGAGLLLKSLHILQQIDPGFRSRNILSMSADLTLSKYPTVRAQVAYFEKGA
jgi:putative ABC transport system permease protein